MDIHFGSPVHCVEGAVGNVTRLLMQRDPIRLTSLVVRRALVVRREVEVGLELVEESRADVIRLRCLKAEIDQMKRYQHSGTAGGASGGAAVWRYGLAPVDVMDGLSFDDIPLLEPPVHPESQSRWFALDASTRVRATNGNMGKLRGLSLAADSGNVSALIVQMGRAWGEMKTSIASSLVAEWGSCAIYLWCDTAGLKQLLPRSTVLSGSFK